MSLYPGPSMEFTFSPALTYQSRVHYTPDMPHLWRVLSPPCHSLTKMGPLSPCPFLSKDSFVSSFPCSIKVGFHFLQPSPIHRGFPVQVSCLFHRDVPVSFLLPALPSLIGVPFPPALPPTWNVSCPHYPIPPIGLSSPVALSSL